jgi:hypothetical protein
MSTPILTPDGLWQLSGASFTKIPPPPPPPPLNPEPTIPANAVVVDLLPSVKWAMNHDAGTPGSSTGTSTYPATAPDGSQCRVFNVTASGKGGEIFHVNVLADSSMYNIFCLETVESSGDWPKIACAEKDMEHVNPLGQYVDMATQLSTYDGDVDITQNQKWISSNVKADPTQLALNVLHTQRRYMRDNGDGTVNYMGIYLDSVYNPFLNASAIKSQPSALWGKNILNLQIQYDSISALQVSFVVWMHVCRVHCWKT